LTITGPQNLKQKEGPAINKLTKELRLEAGEGELVST